MKHQTADGLWRLEIKGKDSATVEDKVAVLTAFQEVFACAPQTEITDFKFIEELKGTFVPFIQEVCKMASVTDNRKAELPMLEEFITVQYSYADCQTAFTSVGE